MISTSRFPRGVKHDAQGRHGDASQSRMVSIGNDSVELEWNLAFSRWQTLLCESTGPRESRRRGVRCWPTAILLRRACGSNHKPRVPNQDGSWESPIQASAQQKENPPLRPESALSEGCVVRPEPDSFEGPPGRIAAGRPTLPARPPRGPRLFPLRRLVLRWCPPRSDDCFVRCAAEPGTVPGVPLRRSPAIPFARKPMAPARSLGGSGAKNNPNREDASAKPCPR